MKKDILSFKTFCSVEISVEDEFRDHFESSSGIVSFFLCAELPNPNSYQDMLFPNRRG